MTVTYTDSLVAVCDYLYDLISRYKSEYGIFEVYYGDQERLPGSPIVCVESDAKPRELKGAQRQTRVDFRVYILVYVIRIDQSIQTSRREADTLTEQIETLIHQKPTLDGLVIHGMCTGIESGYVDRNGTKVRASRLTYEAQSQKILPGTDQGGV